MRQRTFRKRSSVQIYAYRYMLAGRWCWQSTGVGVSIGGELCWPRARNSRGNWHTYGVPSGVTCASLSLCYTTSGNGHMLLACAMMNSRRKCRSLATRGLYANLGAGILVTTYIHPSPPSTVANECHCRDPPVRTWNLLASLRRLAATGGVSLWSV